MSDNTLLIIVAGGFLVGLVAIVSVVASRARAFDAYARRNGFVLTKGRGGVVYPTDMDGGISEMTLFAAIDRSAVTPSGIRYVFHHCKYVLPGDSEDGLSRHYEKSLSALMPCPRFPSRLSLVVLPKGRLGRMIAGLLSSREPLRITGSVNAAVIEGDDAEGQTLIAALGGILAEMAEVVPNPFMVHKGGGLIAITFTDMEIKYLDRLHPLVERIQATVNS